MATQKHDLIKLFSILTLVFLSGCANVTLHKSRALLETELLFQKTYNEVNEYDKARTEYLTAEKTLEAAGEAETEEAMAALVYIANNQLKKAQQVAETEASKKRIRDLRTEKLKLRNNHHKMNKEK